MNNFIKIFIKNEYIICWENNLYVAKGKNLGKSGKKKGRINREGFWILWTPFVDSAEPLKYAVFVCSFVCLSGDYHGQICILQRSLW